jgi:hypothetical protein
MLRHTDCRKLTRHDPNFIPMHKYAVGARVICGAAGGRPKHSCFEVTRLLPDGGFGLQYRIRSEIDGGEMVVVESTLHGAPVRATAEALESEAHAVFSKGDRAS